MSRAFNPESGRATAAAAEAAHLGQRAERGEGPGRHQHQARPPILGAVRDRPEDGRYPGVEK